MSKKMAFAALAAAALVAGCSSFTLEDREAFRDDNGNYIIAEYGKLSSEYKYTIVSPMNGVALECTSRRAVRITLPDGDTGKPTGDTMTFRICQNDSPKGTMYMTADEKWKYLTIGIRSRLYLINEAKTDYLLVFEGQNSPSILEESK